MENLVQFAQAVALFSASALCIYLIVSLVRLNKVLASIQKDVSEVAKGLTPVLSDLAVVAEKLKSITTKVDDQVNLFKGSLEAMRRVAENVEKFEARVQRHLEEPINRITSLVGGIVQKVATIFGARPTAGNAG